MPKIDNDDEVEVNLYATLSTAEIQKIAGLVFDALATDGAHHKQWYLERIFAKLMPKEEFETLQSSGIWDGGIAP